MGGGPTAYFIPGRVGWGVRPRQIRVCRLSVCLSVVCLSVGGARAPRGRRPPLFGPKFCAFVAFVAFVALLLHVVCMFACFAFVLHFIYILFASLLGMMRQLLRQWLLPRMLWMLMLLLLLLLLLLAAAAAAADRFRIGRRACTAQDRTGSSLPWAETLSPTTSTYKESAAIDRAPSLTGLPARLRSLSL